VSNFQISAKFLRTLGANGWAPLERQLGGLQGTIGRVNSQLAQSGRIAAQSWGQVGNVARNTALSVTAAGLGAGLFISRAVELNKENENLQISLSATLNAFDQYGSSLTKNSSALDKFKGSQREASRLFKQFEVDASKSVGTTGDRIQAAQTLAGGVFSSGGGLTQLRALTNRALEVGSILAIDNEQVTRDVAQLLAGQAGVDNLTYSRGLKNFLVSEQEVQASRNKKSGKVKSQTEIFNDLTSADQLKRVTAALERFASKEVLDVVAKSYDANLSTLQDYLQRTQRTFGSAITEQLNGVLIQVNSKLGGKFGKDLEDTAYTLGENIADGIALAIDKGEELYAWTQKNGAQITAFFKGVAEPVQTVANFAGKAATAFKGAGTFVGAATGGQGPTVTAEGAGKIAGGVAAAAGLIALLRGANNLLGGLPGKAVGGLGGLLRGGKGGIPGAAGLAGVTPVYVVNMPGGGLGLDGKLGKGARAGGLARAGSALGRGATTVGRGAAALGRGALGAASMVGRGAMVAGRAALGLVASPVGAVAGAAAAGWGIGRLIGSMTGLDKTLQNFFLKTVFRPPDVKPVQPKAPVLPKPTPPMFNVSPQINAQGLEAATVEAIKARVNAETRTIVTQELAKQEARLRARLEGGFRPPTPTAAVPR
jgi:hypothetical protein